MATENLNITVTAQDLASGQLSRLKNLFVIDLVGAVRIATNAFKSIFNEIAQSERAVINLNSAIEINGRLSSSASQNMQEFAKQIQNATKFSDEESLSIQTLFIQLTNLSERGIQQATKAAISLSTTLGIDLDSAARKVLGAIQGNTRGLERYIGKVDESLNPQEKSVAILNQLAGGFKRAEADANTLEGQIRKLKNEWSELLETFGKTGITNFISETLRGTRLFIQDTTNFFRKFIDSMKIKDVESFRAFQKTLREIEKEQKRLTESTINTNNAFQEQAEEGFGIELASDQMLFSFQSLVEAQTEFQEKGKELAESFESDWGDIIGSLGGGMSTLFDHIWPDTIKKAESTWDAFTDGLEDTFKQALSNMAQELVTSGILNLLTKIFFPTATLTKSTGIVGKILGIFGLKEGGILPGGFTPFQHGGIVSRPTLGLVGESGPEAIIPLRGSRGREMMNQGPIMVNLTLDGRQLASTMIDLKRRGALQGRL